MRTNTGRTSIPGRNETTKGSQGSENVKKWGYKVNDSGTLDYSK